MQTDGGRPHRYVRLETPQTHGMRRCRAGVNAAIAQAKTSNHAAAVVIFYPHERLCAKHKDLSGRHHVKQFMPSIRDKLDPHTHPPPPCANL